MHEPADRNHAARPVVDTAKRDDVDVVEHEVSGRPVVEGGPRRDVAAQSEVKQILALLLGHVDRIVRCAVRALEVPRDLPQEYIEIVLAVPIRHQDGELARSPVTTGHHGDEVPHRALAAADRVALRCPGASAIKLRLRVIGVAAESDPVSKPTRPSFVALLFKGSEVTVIVMHLSRLH